jgi:lipoyl-dependent peroxiredoxin
LPWRARNFKGLARFDFCVTCSTPPRREHQHGTGKKVYTAHATTTGGRGGGIAKTDDGKLNLTLSHPKEMGGDGKGTNPDQLFAAGYAACFLGAMRYANSQQKKPEAWSNDNSVTSHVTFGPRKDKKGFGIEVQLDVKLIGVSKAKAATMAKRGHVVCPYSDAIKKNVKVTTKLV